MTKNQMEERLKQNYPDGEIEIIDLTGGEDHWEVHVASQKFTGLSRIQMHQQVMQVFAPELKSGEVHALTLKTILKK
jgi:stress-induced morphogen